VQAQRKNIERMIEKVPDADYQAVQHFITHSPWEYEPVMDQVADDSNRLLGASPDSALFIDECSTPKKGKKSVGVARQWCGRLGKVDNCQTGVFAALNKGPYATLIDTRLYLPAEWADDRKRCKDAGVPKDVVFKTKSELALEMVRSARERGIGFSWVGIDSGYGKETPFLYALDDCGDTFVADVAKDQNIYLEEPLPYLPERTSSRGRRPTRLTCDAAPVRVDEWVASQPHESWQRLAFRETTKGRRIGDFLFRRVWLWNKKEARGRCFTLIVRREPGKHDIKYSLTNAEANTPRERLAFMQGQRYFVERSFQDAKSYLGMGQYQVRSWQSWHHHMALVMMAMLFMLEVKLEQHRDVSLLSTADIVALLAHYLPRRDLDEEELFRQMELRHRKRQESIDSAYAVQRARGLM
jgi:SRSO17 transposase